MCTRVLLNPTIGPHKFLCLLPPVQDEPADGEDIDAALLEDL